MDDLLVTIEIQTIVTPLIHFTFQTSVLFDSVLPNYSVIMQFFITGSGSVQVPDFLNDLPQDLLILVTR